MLKFLFGRTCIVIACLFLAGMSSFARGSKTITFDDLYKNGTFSTKMVGGFNAMNDGLHFTRIERKEGGVLQINQYRLSDGRFVATLYDNSWQLYENQQMPVEDYAFDANEKKMLLFTESENIYRRSVLHKVYIFDLQSKSITLLDEDKVLHAAFNIQGTQVAFVKSNNLYVNDLQNHTKRQITTDGEWNRIINGNCDWVYEEEFEFTQAYQWSPDGKYIAYYRFDESRVKEFTIPMYDSVYPTLYTYKYPKAGEDNSIVSIHIYDVVSGKTVTADAGPETNQYIPRISWADQNRVCIYRLNRLQNKLELLLSDAATGSSKVIYTEENKYFIKINDNISFQDNGKKLLITSERDGWNHLYLYDIASQSFTQLTSGAWNVDELIGMDIQSGNAWYTAGVASPLERKLYVVNLKKRRSVCLTPQDGWHMITPCNGFKYFLDRYSNLNTVPHYTLMDAKGKVVRTLEDNSKLASTMAEYDLGKVQMMQVPGAEGTLLNAWMITPPDFESTKKYPVLMYQYSGPGSQEVKNFFPLGNYFWHQMLAQKGYIVFCADGTGTGARGEVFEKKTYLQLGKQESDDQIAIAKYLATQPYVDAGRIGIWGWSFGGFMSSTCILKGADVFKAAIAVAPVTNWRYYDNIYTERYMRTPRENPEGYDGNAPEKMAERLKGKFLLIHGTADDNVHFQNAVMLTKNLVEANKSFESEYYPDKNHGIHGGMSRRQLFERITVFIEQNL